MTGERYTERTAHTRVGTPEKFPDLQGFCETVRGIEGEDK